MDRTIAIENLAFFTVKQASRANKAWTKKSSVVNTARPMSPALRPWKWPVLTGLIFSMASSVFCQTNLLSDGGELGIAQNVAGNQLRPAAAFSSAGGFAVWEDNTEISGVGIRGVRLNPALQPTGAEFPINESIGGDQQRPAVVLLDNGGAVIVWEHRPIKGLHSVHARFLDGSGAFVTGELVVNQIPYSGKYHFVTNWTLIRNNKPRTRKQRIRAVVKARQEYNLDPAVVKLADGSVVVTYGSSRKSALKSVGLNEQIVWNDKRQMIMTNRTRVPINVSVDYMQDVYLQRFSADGARLGGEAVVNATLPFNQRNPSIAALPDGGFVVCWVSEAPSFNSERVDSRATQRGLARADIAARLFHADGSPAGGEFRINTTNMPCAAPAVAARADGGFVVAWTQHYGGSDSGADVWFRSYDSSGAAQGVPARANARVYGDQFAPAIGTIGQRQLIVWSSMGQDGSWEGVYGTQIENGGIVDDEFRVNTTRYLRQIHPSVAVGGGRALVLWSSYAYEHGFDVLGQRYAAPQ
jgi:hypothetical protein